MKRWQIVLSAVAGACAAAFAMQLLDREVADAFREILNLMGGALLGAVIAVFYDAVRSGPTISVEATTFFDTGVNGTFSGYVVHIENHGRQDLPPVTVSLQAGSTTHVLFDENNAPPIFYVGSIQSHKFFVSTPTRKSLIIGKSEDLFTAHKTATLYIKQRGGVRVLYQNDRLGQALFAQVCRSEGLSLPARWGEETFTEMRDLKKGSHLLKRYLAMKKELAADRSIGDTEKAAGPTVQFTSETIYHGPL